MFVVPLKVPGAPPTFYLSIHHSNLTSASNTYYICIDIF